MRSVCCAFLLLCALLCATASADERPQVAQLIGSSAATLERLLGPPTAREQGWVRYGDAIAVRMEGGIARRVRVRTHITDGPCAEVLRAEGFSDAGPALRRRSACEWPGRSLRHRVDRRGRLAARLDLRTEVLEVWFRRAPPQRAP